MFRHFIDPPDPVPTRSFAEEMRDLVVERTRTGMLFAVAASLAMLSVDFAVADSPWVVTAVRGAVCVVLLLLWVLGGARSLPGLATWLPFAAVSTIGAGLLLLLALSDPAGSHHAFHEMSLVILVVATGAMLPLGMPSIVPLLAVPVGLQLVHAVVQEEALWAWPGIFGSAMALIIGSALSEVSCRLRRREHAGRAAKDALLSARNDFVAMITHDIKNPVGVILGYVELLQETEHLSEEGHDMLRRVRSAAERTLLLANNLLDVSRIGSGRLHLKPKLIDLDHLLGQVIATQGNLSEQKELSLLHENNASLPLIAVDEVLLERVFVNLVNNAIKFTPKGGEVRVVTRPVGEGAEVLVEDTGPGIPAGLEGHLFERFTDVSGRRDSTGLGLFIVKSIVEAHGGTVLAANRTDRSGACFRVWLPLRRTGDESPTAERRLRSAT